MRQYWPQTTDMLLNIHRPSVQQGWQCPVCYAVHAPWVVACQGCEAKKPESAVEQ